MANKFKKNIGIENIPEQQSKNQAQQDDKVFSRQNTVWRTQRHDTPPKMKTIQFKSNQVSEL